MGNQAFTPIRRAGILLIAAGVLFSLAGMAPTLRADDYAEQIPLVIDGQFSSESEWVDSDRLDSFFDLGWIYLRVLEDWEVGGTIYRDTITVAIMHYFNDENYDEKHSYDLNWFQLNFPNGRSVSSWVFMDEECEPGEDWDHQWVLAANLETSNCYDAANFDFRDDGGFLVREGAATTSDILFNFENYGRLQPGHPDWDFEDFHGVYAKAGFNISAKTMNYDHDVPSPAQRQLYEWSITFPTDWGMPTLNASGLSKDLGSAGSGYEWLTKESDPPPIRVKDWKTELGANWGDPGTPNWADSMTLATFYEGTIYIRGTGSALLGDGEQQSVPH